MTKRMTCQRLAPKEWARNHHRPTAITLSAACAVCLAIASLSGASARLPGGASSAAGRAPVQRCERSELSVRVRHSFAGLGTAGAYIAFTNRSDRSCWLAGWPTVNGISFAGRPIHTRHRPARDFPDVSAAGALRVVLHHGQRADSVFDGADGPPAGHRCGQRLRWLEVTAPGSVGVVRVSAWIEYLDRYMPTCSSIRVSPVLPANDLHRG